MKDIRIVQGDGPLGTELEIFGRPQDRTMSDNGNISHATLDSIDGLSTESIVSALIIDEDLFPKGSGIWGGVNDVIKVGLHAYVLVGHRAWRTGENGTGRHYESVLYGYHARTRRIVELGVLATAADFPGGVVKDDQETNLTDVVFSGGGYNGSLDYMSCGVGDGNVGLLKIQRKR
jgi:hypothetical protein